MARSLTGKVAYNTAIQLGGRVINMAVSLVTVGVLARYLGVEGFGFYTIIITFTGVVSILSDLGLPTQLIKEITNDRVDKSKAVGDFVTLRAVSATVLVIVGLGLGWLIYGVFSPYPTFVVQGIGLGLLGVWLGQLATIFTSVLQVKLKLYIVTLSDVAARLAQLGVVLWLVSAGADLVSIIATMILGNLIYLAGVYVMSRREIPWQISVDTKYWIDQLKVAWPLSVLVILGSIHYRIDLILLSILQDSTAVGIYGLPYKVVDAAVLLPGAFIATAFPVYASYAHGGGDLKTAYQKSFDLMSFFAVPLVFGAFMLARPITDLLGGKEFYDAAALLQILSLSLAASFLTSVGRALLVSKDLQGKIVLVFLAAIFLNVTLNLILIPVFSYFGAAWATVSSEFLLLGLELYLLKRYLSLWPGLGILAKAVLSSAIMAISLAGILTYSQNVFLLVTVGVAVYFTAMFLTGGIKKDTVRLLIR